MSVTCSEAVLFPLSEFVATRLGLHFPRERWADLDRGVRAACKECGIDDPVAYAGRFLNSTATRAEIELLASRLTVGETHFFRHRRSLEIIEEHILPQLTDRPLRIWSAGCSTGEEPYTLAMVLSSRIPSGSVTILATDLNTRSLQKASEGIYGEWSFRDTPQWIRGKYFSPTVEGQWRIDQSIRNMVKFAYSNLVEGPLPCCVEPMDLIFCRNVMMYFHPEVASKVVADLHRSLKEGGWLFVSPAETSPTLFKAFAPVSFGDISIYRKREFERTIPAPPPDTFVDEPADYSQDTDHPQDSAHSQGEVISTSSHEDMDRAPAMLRLARLCANRGRLRDALQRCEKAIATGKTGSEAHYLQAAILEELGLFEESAGALRRALYLEPGFAIAHFALGNLACKRGQHKQAAKHFENTLNILSTYQRSKILPASDGLTAGRLRELIAQRTKGVVRS